MTYQIDSLANNKYQSPSEYLAAIRALDDTPHEFYEKSDFKRLDTAVEAEDDEDIAYVADYCLEAVRTLADSIALAFADPDQPGGDMIDAAGYYPGLAEAIALLTDPDKLDEDIGSLITDSARISWLHECCLNNEVVPPHVLEEYRLWDPDFLISFTDRVRSSSPWCHAVRYFVALDNRFLRTENYRLTTSNIDLSKWSPHPMMHILYPKNDFLALNKRPRVKPHPPFPQWYEEALAYPLPDEHPDVFKKYYRKRYEEFRSRLGEQLEGNELLGKYVLQTAPNPAFCPGIKPQVEIRGRTGTLLTPQLASQASQFDELLSSSQQVMGKLPLPQASESKEKGTKKKPGPKGPRKASANRRTAIKLLKQESLSGLEACKRLKDMKIPLPSKRLQTLYSKCDWVQWFNFDPKAFHKQWSADLKRPDF